MEMLCCQLRGVARALAHQLNPAVPSARPAFLAARRMGCRPEWRISKSMIMHQVKPAMMGLIRQITRHQPFLRLAIPSRDMLYVGQKEP